MISICVPGLRVRKGKLGVVEVSLRHPISHVLPAAAHGHVIVMTNQKHIFDPPLTRRIILPEEVSHLLSQIVAGVVGVDPGGGHNLDGSSLGDLPVNQRRNRGGQ